MPKNSKSSKPSASTMSHANSVRQYKDRLKQEAEDLLITGFPARIMRLNALLETPQFKKRDFADIHQAFAPPRSFENGDTFTPPAKRLKVEQPPNATPFIIKTNKHLTALIDTVKPHMVRLVEDAKKIKMWIAFMIPKIEDGNNFGVEIQEETLALVGAVESTAALFYERVSKYFTDRAKVVRSVYKYPDVEDFRRGVHELDEKEYLGFCLVLAEIRNQYCALHDIFLKNLDKIKTPRSDIARNCLY